MSDGQIQTVLLTCHEIFRQLSSKYPSIYSHESHEIFKWHKLSIKTIKHVILTNLDAERFGSGTALIKTIKNSFIEQKDEFS